MSDRILVTGANGFVGSALCRRLDESGFSIRRAVRVQTRFSPGETLQSQALQSVVLDDQSTEDATKRALDSVQAVIHLAARVHIMTDRAPDPLREFRRVNAKWTERLALAGASQGVRRFVYLSSIKVNGEQTTVPFTEQDLPNPSDAYGISKREAEQLLAEVSAKTGLETVVLRSPLVYGPGVAGNFLELLKIVHRGIPLPLAGIRNQRSLIYRENLLDALIRCIQDRRAGGQTYLVSDGQDLSTPALIQRLGAAMGTNVHLWPFPTAGLRWIGRITGKGNMVDRLVGSLQVDPSKIRRDLDWHPPFSVDTGLSDTSTWFLNRASIYRASGIG